jgi:hypothetical protein
MRQVPLGSVQNLRVAVFALMWVLQATPVRAADDDLAVGSVVAAVQIGARCDGLGVIGGNEIKAAVMATTDLLGEQGYRRQKLRAALFYGKSEMLNQMAVQVLAARDVKMDDRKALCRFGSAVVGTTDMIGQLLTRTD